MSIQASNEIPRRRLYDKLTLEEKELRDLIGAVEDLGADPLLTDCVVLLDQAFEKLADYLDYRATGSDRASWRASRTRIHSALAVVRETFGRLRDRDGGRELDLICDELEARLAKEGREVLTDGADETST